MCHFPLCVGEDELDSSWIGSGQGVQRGYLTRNLFDVCIWNYMCRVCQDELTSLFLRLRSGYSVFRESFFWSDDRDVLFLCCVSYCVKSYCVVLHQGGCVGGRLPFGARVSAIGALEQRPGTGPKAMLSSGVGLEGATINSCGGCAFYLNTACLSSVRRTEISSIFFSLVSTCSGVCSCGMNIFVKRLETVVIGTRLKHQCFYRSCYGLKIWFFLYMVRCMRRDIKKLLSRT